MFFLVSPKYKFLMGWSAKCGCSSVKRWYLDVHDIRPADLGEPVYKAIGYGNTTFTQVVWNQPELYANYQMFAVVRNPYSRLVSGFVNKYIIESRLQNAGWTTFNEFLEFLVDDKEFKAVDKHHFTPQFSENYRGFTRAGFSFDRVIKLEQLADGLKAVSEAIGADLTHVPVANQTNYGIPKAAVISVGSMKIADFDKENIPPHQYFYDDKSIALVREIYKLDFQNLTQLGIQYDAPDVR